MNPLIRFKTTSQPLFIAFAFACVALAQRAQATDLDGVLPGANTADGFGVLVNGFPPGFANSGFGYVALHSLVDGRHNTAIGALALLSDGSGSFNTATGYAALAANDTDFNSAFGYLALLSNTTGRWNSAFGFRALEANTILSGNTAIGARALHKNTGGFNTASGFDALFCNNTGEENTANGDQALYANTTGGFNTASGFRALYKNTTGSGNTALGVGAGHNVVSADNVISIGSPGSNSNNTCFIGNIRGVTTDNDDAIPVVIDSLGQLGTMSSSRRFKHEIKPMDRASEAILALKPVTFHYKSDNSDRAQFGLIAEEVAKVNPDLVVRDKDGEIYTVRYDAVNAMLLNEFLKEHRRNEEQEATMTQLKSIVATQEATIGQQRKDLEANTAQQQKEIQALTARLTEQAAQIQKVSAELEVKKPAPKVVRNNP